METPDYIVELCTFIRNGGRSDASGYHEHYIDSVAFWRNACKKSQDVEHQLRVRVLHLEQRLEAVTGTTDQTTQETPPTQSKRKKGRPTAADTSGGRVGKKAKPVGTASASGANISLPFLIGHEVEFTGDTNVKTCLHRIYEIQRTIGEMRNSTTTAKDLAQLAIQSATDARRIMSSIQTFTTLNASPPKKAPNTTTRTQEQQAEHTHADLVSDADIKCAAILWLFPFLVRTLKSLSELPGTKSFQAQVVHCIISTFEALLEHICTLSAYDGVQRSAVAAKRVKVGKRRGRLLAETADFLAAPSESPRPPTGDEKDRVIKKLCQLAVAMMDDLDTSGSIGQELFDGFLFFLFLRVGDSLKVFVFDDKASGSATDMYGEDSSVIYQAQAQAPYLVYLLQHATNLNAKNFRPDEASLRAGSTESPTHKLDSEADSMSTVAKLRLQHTLLKAVFGEQADEFVQSLKKPVCASIDPGMEIRVVDEGQKEQSTSKWFKDKVWETVGWDVLRGMIHWP